MMTEVTKCTERAIGGVEVGNSANRARQLSWTSRGDLPNWLRTDNGPLLALPYNLEVNDSIIYAIEKHSSPEMLLRLTNTLELFQREVKATGQPRVLALGLHPHLIAVPHRFQYLRLRIHHKWTVRH